MAGQGRALSRRAALALSAAGAAAALGCGARAAAPPLPMTEIAPGILVHQGVHELATATNLGAIANVGFVVGDDAVAVIDSGGCAAAGARLLAAVRAVTARPIRYVIASHVHPDHVLGHAAFLPEAPIFVGHVKLTAALAARGAYYLAGLEDDLGAVAAGTEIVMPTLTVRERATIDLGGRTLELIAHPTAHTDNDLSVRDPATGTVWLADLLFMERVPVIDGSLLGWLQVLETVRGWPTQRVVPGHGPASAPWPGAAAAQVRYLERLRDEVRALITRGATIESAVATVAGGERPSWRLFDRYHGRNVTAAFTELEWE